ncbi:MAG TPA: hypothetical protein VKW06_19930 [Candidatus Angelobacter sp.]|nr:hypothetical protein [Candidatus Angelobacter sp.]
MRIANRFYLDSRHRGQSGRGRLGAVSGLLLAGAMLCLLLFGLYPWAFNIGGRFSPWTMWNGYGKLQSSTGATYGLYLQFWLKPHRGPGPSNNLQGNAILCTPKGMTYKYQLGANVTKAWSTTEGKTTYVYLYRPKGSQQLEGIDFVGVWRNGELVLDDKGNMRMSFKPDGTLAGKGWTTVSPSKEHVWGTIAYGTENDFQAVCKSVSGS